MNLHLHWLNQNVLSVKEMWERYPAEKNQAFLDQNLPAENRQPIPEEVAHVKKEWQAARDKLLASTPEDVETTRGVAFGGRASPRRTRRRHSRLGRKKLRRSTSTRYNRRLRRSTLKRKKARRRRQARKRRQTRKRT